MKSNKAMQVVKKSLKKQDQKASAKYF